MPSSSLHKQCKTLKLAHVPRLYLEVPYTDQEQYLTALFAAEIEARHARKVADLVKRSGFPVYKTMDNFDWGPVTLPTSTTIQDLKSLAFLEQHQNVLALGSVGTGKTYLAIALGIQACMKAKKVRFYRCMDLVNTLLEKHRQERLARFMKDLKKMDLLIIDELGFVPLNRDGAELLFNVIAQAYEKQSVIITSNLQFGLWNSVLGDNRLAAALIDRLVHHAHILAFEGESYRLKHALSTVSPSQDGSEQIVKTMAN